ncbi:Rid family hydrolase [Altericroceibacterium xinjiangense]|uniref:Rid family hydrolase n=1 Tax=Altericroceibacterium xinjiangense TaxID=762261 RepID=UPI001F4A02DE|nr:Rid family hydrolase [Altericroceibacterium xinjiangense]
MAERRCIPPLSPFEEEIGFTRALRTGNRIVVSGTVGVEEDGSVAPDAGTQADRCFTLIARYIEELGGRTDDVVRVRMFVTDIQDADAVSAAFSRHLKHARPTGTLVAIAALYDSRWKVEIEAEAEAEAVVEETP